MINLVTLYYNNGKIKYWGEADEKGKYHGKGIAFYLSGSIAYEGQFKNNKFHGVGKIYNPSGKLVYHGELKNSIKHGVGQLYSNNEELLYEGEFLNDFKDGFGREFDINTGDILFQGDFESNKKIYEKENKLSKRII